MTSCLSITRSAIGRVVKCALLSSFRRIGSIVGSRTRSTWQSAAQRIARPARNCSSTFRRQTALAQTGLPQNSMIQCENVLTYDQRLVIAKIGELSLALSTQQVNDCLKVALDLAREAASSNDIDADSRLYSHPSAFRSSPPSIVSKALSNAGLTPSSINRRMAVSEEDVYPAFSCRFDDSLKSSSRPCSAA